jgi:hypothetical protein
MVTASVQTDAGDPVPDTSVSFLVSSGPNAGEAGTQDTSAIGMADFAYRGNGGVGVDEITASFVDTRGDLQSDEALKFWDEDCNSNVIPDTCDLDCDGFDTSCDAFAGCGQSLDENGNGVPDECPSETQIIDLAPTLDLNPLDTLHTVMATVRSEAGDPVPGIGVAFLVTSGPNAGEGDTADTDSAGMAEFSYFGDADAGVDQITASFVDIHGDLQSDEATKFWDDDCNENVVPDTCDLDCGGFGASCNAFAGCGQSLDQTGDGVPDECVLEVQIDLKPRSRQNTVNTSGGGLLPKVALLGSQALDVRDVDVNTLRFGRCPTPAASAIHDLNDSRLFGKHLKDVNGDGFTDLVSHYRQTDAMLQAGDTEVCLTGQLTSGLLFRGRDHARVR